MALQGPGGAVHGATNVVNGSMGLAFQAPRLFGIDPFGKFSTQYNKKHDVDAKSSAYTAGSVTVELLSLLVGGGGAGKVGQTAVKAVRSTKGAANGDALGAAMSKADELAPIRPGRARSTVAEGLGLPGGATIAHGSKVGEAPVLNARIQKILDGIPAGQRGVGHGHCGLAQCLSDALDSGIDPTGSDAAAVLVRGSVDHPRHGFGIGPCASCRPLADEFNLNFVTGN